MGSHQHDRGLEYEPGEQSLREQGLLSLEKGCLWGELLAACKNIGGNYQGDEARLFTEVHSGRKTDSGHKLEQVKFGRNKWILFFFYEDN